MLRSSVLNCFSLNQEYIKKQCLIELFIYIIQKKQQQQKQSVSLQPKFYNRNVVFFSIPEGIVEEMYTQC